jgi:hypothetical protein
MKGRSLSVCIAVGAGLALMVLVGLTITAAAGPAPPEAQATTVKFWSSPWRAILKDFCQVFNHNLGGDPEDYAVELLFMDTDGGLGIHRRGYGGLEVSNTRAGAHWQNLTANTIEVCRHKDDNDADKIRVQVRIPDPHPEDYEGEWMDIDPGQTLNIIHNVGVTATELTVGLWFSGTARGIHQYGHGGLVVDGPPPERRGAFWHNLTDTDVQVTRRPDDTDVEQVRAVVVHADPPAYDSLLQAPGGWQFIGQGSSFVFNHGLQWDPNLLLVRAECKSLSLPVPRGIHQINAGGNHDPASGWEGVDLRNLTANSVAVARQSNDVLCPQVRVRIWKRSVRVYLPLVLRGS